MLWYAANRMRTCANQKVPGRVRSLDEQEGKLTIVQLHPDSASMEFHMQVNAKHFTTAFEVIESVVGEQYYGAVSQTLATELAKWDDPAVAVTRMPTYEGGSPAPMSADSSRENHQRQQHDRRRSRSAATNQPSTSGDPAGQPDDLIWVAGGILGIDPTSAQIDQ
jgi:hypothetical protein